MEETTHIHTGGEWTRVLALLAHVVETIAPDEANGSLPDWLREEFTSRDWYAVVHHDPYLMLADLAVRDRTQAARAAWGLQRLERLAMVIVEPGPWPAEMLEELIEAAAEHFPQASIWRARDGRLTRAEVSPPVAPHARPGRATALRAVGASSRDPQPRESHVHTPPAVVRAERLSRAEIDMLLHLDDGIDMDPDRSGLQ